MAWVGSSLLDNIRNAIEDGYFYTAIEFDISDHTIKILQEELGYVVSPIKLFNYKFKISWNYTE